MRKIQVRSFVRKVILFVVLSISTINFIGAQTVQIGTGTDFPANTLYSPVYRFSATSTTSGSRSNILYLQSELAAAGIPAGAQITSIEFNKVNDANFVIPATHSMLMANTSNTVLPTTTTWASILSTHTQVYTSNSFNIPFAGGWVSWNITPFIYTGGSLEIATETAMAGNGGATGPFQWQYTAGTPTDLIVGAASATATTLNGTTSQYKNRPNIRITFISGPCTSPPNAGTATVNPATPLCVGDAVSLGLTGFSSGSGQTYQWESAPAIGGPYTAVSGSLTVPSFDVMAPAGTVYYRCAVTCSGNTQFSTPVEVTGSGGLAGGTYSINSAVATGGTNFQSFTDAVAALKCGISGPVVFNVDPLSGPYDEQVIINQINGSSAINTVTFNGNGRTLQYTSTNTSERAVIKLNGADHVIIDSLVIHATGTTTSQYGFGIHLTNEADSNIIRRSTIITNDSLTSTNYAGIVISAGTTAVATGNAGCDDNLFENNTVLGGYYGITNVGSGTGLANQRNRYAGNKVLNFYIYGFYVNGTFEIDIDGNEISRPLRKTTTTTTSYGIYFTSLSTKAKVNGNYIYGLFDYNSTSTSTVYGIYFLNCDALAGLENRVTNNAVYGMVSNGIVYGIANSGSDYVNYYHNTISLDDDLSTATGATGGFYVLGTFSGGVATMQFKNNLITLRRGGTGVMHALYLTSATVASAVESNNNNVFFLPASNLFFGYDGTNHATLSAWQTATSKDANSSEYNPNYVNRATGNLKPTSAAMNDLGMAIGISTDILNVSRSVTTPDIGAWEFDVGGCTAPPNPGESSSSATGPICPNETVTLRLLNNSFGTGQTYQWQSGPTNAGPWTDISSQDVEATMQINPTTTLFYRCAVTCSGSTTYSIPVEVVVNSLFPAGTYTINKAQPTGGTNFASFNDAYNALRCGIAGPIVFNVVPGSGPYNEQLIMGQVQGTSAINTVTWNGNGEIITFLSTNTAERAVIKFNGTDHFVFDSLTVVAAGTATTEYGFGFHLTDGADSNIIRKCIVNVNTTSTSTNYAGIVSSAGTTAIASGSNGSDYNLIENNTITGGYYGITNIGSTTESVANNRIIGNKVSDYYSYGIYLSGNFQSLVEGNDMSRPARSGFTTHYGIYVTSLNTSLNVSKNRIHNPADANTSSTSIFYGIYVTGTDALTGLENVFSNNAIYEVHTSGSQYGFYNSSSDNAYYYHNTVDLSSNLSSSSLTYAFYQITTATGLDYKDNLINITRNTSGNKVGLYFSTSATTFTSNYNSFNFTGDDSYVGYFTTLQETLAEWRTAASQDANSLMANPFFTSPSTGDLTPRSPVLDNKGTPITGITTDIINAARSVTTPDIGAWEFVVPPCTTPPDAGVATAVPNSNICLGTSIQLDLSGNTFGAGQSYQWQFATTVAGPFTNLGNQSLFSDTLITATGSFVYRCIVTCSGQSDTSATVQVTLNPSFPAGTYTINNTQPTNYPGGTNFNSFVEAVAVMDCGIDGPVIFNVAASTYNEQVRIKSIYGTSAINTVTFQSADANAASVNLTYDGSSAANYVLQLDSANHIIFRNITITAQNATYGRAIYISNTASNDSILNCVITAPATTSISTNLAVVFGTDLSGNNIVLKGNTVTGGSSGIYLASTAAAGSSYFVIDSNTVSGAYQYNIYSSTLRFTSVTRNNIVVAAPRNSTSYGIYLSNNDSAYQVNDNKVMINGTITTTYGIYLTGCAAEANTGSISRNKVVSSTDNTGSLYGIYQTTTQGNYTRNNVVNITTSATTAYGTYSTGGTGGIKYYNNSVQNNSPTKSITNIAAYFNHTSSSLGAVDIRNNIFNHTASGIAMYQGSNTSTVYLDYNLYYTAGDTLIRQVSTYFGTLQAWRDAVNWDYSSLVIEPALTGTELLPNLSDGNVWAFHGRGVQIADNNADINGNPRPTTLTTGVPDLGAYEFFPSVPPPALQGVPAAPAAGTTQVFFFGTDTVQKVTWAPASVVPDAISVQRYSGVIPPGLTAGLQSMYYYNDVNITGNTPSNYTMQQFYIDSWLRDIPVEQTVKMGRTTATGEWFVSANSAVDDLANVITESNLSYIKQFTGSTDGKLPPGVQPPGFSTDTSNAGRRFWVAYGHHYGFSSNSQDMVLYLSAEDSANVTVKVNGTNWVRTYNIPANTVRVSDIMPKSGLVDARITDEGLYNKGISIESDVPIVAYAHIYDGSNSGAGMLLPTGTYGYEYVSLNSRQYYPAGGAGSYSWTYVIADRDSTLVEITPSVQTKSGRPAGVSFQVYLKRGEVYNVMGTQTGADGTDLSGTLVRSVANASGNCYPVAVFSGSSRTAICNTTNGDNFIQQVFPRTAWGTKYLTFATANSTSPTLYNSNIYRVMVKDPATVVSLNGTTLNPATLITPGNYYEFSTTQGNGSNGAIYVEADQPVLMAQYMVSTSGTLCPGVTATGNGDPELIYISPIEQGIKRARFYSTNENSITSNYVNVIVPTAALPSFQIDGSTTFTDVFPHPFLAGYTCIRQNLSGSAAQHFMSCDSAFTAIAYGLGSVESYGYNAGTLVKNLSATPSFTNVFSTTSQSKYTCEGSPFKLSLQISLKPTQLIWNLNRVSGLSPNAAVTQTNPAPSDSVTVGGRKFYIYTLPQDYTVNQVGAINIPITLFHPSIEGCGGSVEVSLTINVLPKPVADFSTGFSGCIGDPVQFNGTATTNNNVPVSQWLWNFGDNTTNNVQNPLKNYISAGTYNVNLRIIGEDGCLTDTVKQVVVNPRPVPATAQDTVGVCANANAVFTVQNPVAGTTYRWYSAATGGTLLGTGTSYSQTAVTGFVNIYLEAEALGCVSETRKRVTAAVLPTLQAPVVTVDSTGTNIIIFRWNVVPNATGYEVSINNGASWTIPSSGSQGLTHTVSGLQVGATVTLQVRALGGCETTSSMAVSGQTRTDQIFIPSAFTPNGDGVNDVWRIYSNVIRSSRVMIFNQWGEKIFESSNLNAGWDGVAKGKQQPSGVYMYVADITLNSGDRIVRKGAINLVR